MKAAKTRVHALLMCSPTAMMPCEPVLAAARAVIEILDPIDGHNRFTCSACRRPAAHTSLTTALLPLSVFVGIDQSQMSTSIVGEFCLPLDPARAPCPQHGGSANRPGPALRAVHSAGSRSGRASDAAWAVVAHRAKSPPTPFLARPSPPGCASAQSIPPPLPAHFLPSGPVGVCRSFMLR